MLTTLQARTLFTETERIEYPILKVEDGTVVSVEAGPPNGSSETLTAAYLDIHVHGAMTHDFMTASTSQIHEIGRFLASRGVAHYLPTTVTGPLDLTLRALEKLGAAIAAGSPHDAATPVGIHLEGPFVSHAKRGVHPPHSILEPSIEIFDRFQEAAQGQIRLVTMAPELPNAIALIEHLSASGIRVSMGHSDANEAETLSAIAAGASSATHLFNAMRALDHREPGIVGTILDREDVYAEAICDGVHVHPALVRLWLKMKGPNRAILVTDGTSATGMPDGVYMLGDFPVEVRNGVCLSNGVLAGSTLTMDYAVEMVQRFTGTTLQTASRLASHNPAEMLGMPELARIAPGSPANFNLYDERGRFTGSILKGRRVPRQF